MTTQTPFPPLKVDSSCWIVRFPEIPIQEEDPLDLIPDDTEETIKDFERFQGLFPWESHPYNLSAWFDDHAEIALKQYQEFLDKKFEYLGHTFKPVYSFEADNARFPLPFVKENQQVSLKSIPIEGWKSSDFWTCAEEAELGSVKIFLMDDEYYILPTDSYPSIYSVT